MVFWVFFAWALGMSATIHRYFAGGHDMYRPNLHCIVCKPYRAMARDLKWIIFAWPLVVVWASYRHIKRYW